MRLVEKTRFTEDGALQIESHHNMVNRWNKTMAVGLRHNHDITFIGTQSKTIAIVLCVAPAIKIQAKYRTHDQPWSAYKRRLKSICWAKENTR